MEAIQRDHVSQHVLGSGSITTGLVGVGRTGLDKDTQA